MNEETFRETTLTKEEKQWALASHLSAFAGFVFPFGNIIAPLLIYLLKKDEMPFVQKHAKESLNFQISMTIYFIIGFILMLLIVGIAIVAVLTVAEIVLIIVAALKANDGLDFKYPFTIRFIN